MSSKISLLECYELVEKAEKLCLAGQYGEAAILHKQASDGFKQSINMTDNKEINNALDLLVKQHARRAKELAVMDQSKSNLSATPPSPMSQSVILNSNNISSSLASARGIMNENHLMSGSMVLNDDIDPLTKFQVQVYNLIKPPTLNNVIETPERAVKKSGKTIEELEMENHMLKQLVVRYSENIQIYESFHNKVKNNLRNYLNTLRRDLKLQEATKRKEYEAKLEASSKENHKLEAQTRKLKQRWDELVQSAKKRRDESKT